MSPFRHHRLRTKFPVVVMQIETTNKNNNHWTGSYQPPIRWCPDSKWHKSDISAMDLNPQLNLHR